MKRFSILFCMACVAMSMRALPARPVVSAAALPAVETLPALFAEPQPKQVVSAADVVYLETSAIEWRQQKANGAWFVGAIDKDSTYIFYFYYESETLTGTFALEDMTAKYSYMVDYTSGKKVQYPYTAATLTIAQDAKGVTLNADMEADGKRYVLTGFEKVLLPKDTVVYSFPEANMQKGSGAVVIDGEIEGEVIASALIYTTNVVGSYTAEDFEMVWSTFVRFPNKPNVGDSTFVEPLDCCADVTLEDGAYHFDISLLGTDTVLYRLHLYHPMTVTDTVDIAINNLSIDLSAVGYMGTFFLDGSNNDYMVTIACLGKGEDGVYDGAETATATITALADETVVRSVNTKLTLVTVGGVREADAEVYGSDDKFYRIHMVFTIPEPKKTVDIVFAGKGNGIYYREDGSFYIYNEDARYIVAMEIYTDQPEGQYERGDFRPRYTYVGLIEGNDTIGVAMYTASATITKQGSDYLVKAEMLGTDTVLYRIGMTVDYRYIAIQYDKLSDEFVANYTDADQVAFNTRNFLTDGYVSFTALSKTGKLTYLEFYPAAIDPATTLPAGTYPVESTENKGTVYAGQGVLNNSIVGSVCGDYTSQGMNVPCFFVAEGTVKVETADGKLRLTLVAQNTNGRPIRMVYEGTTGLTAIENTPADMPAVRKIVRDGQVYILYGADTYTTTGVLLNK